MRVVVASTYVPFIPGGGLMIFDSLARELKRRKVDVDTVKLPVWPYWRELQQQTLALRLLDLTESAGTRIDRLITIRYPSYALRHPNKVSWFIHHHRGAYDLWGTPHQDLPNDPEGQRERDSLIKSDTLYLRECRKVFTNSKVVGDRLRRFNGIEPDEVLYPPHPNPELFRAGDFGDYFVYASRLTPLKRQALAIEAMRFVRSPFKLLLIGAADVGAYGDEVRALVRRHGLASRVELLGWQSEEEKARLTAGACGALYLAYDEDSYGYSSLEAFHAHKSVITLTDSGGPNEVIQDGHNGLVAEPDARALARAMDRLWSDKRRARDMGEQAFATLATHRIHWDNVVERLLA